MTPILVEFPFKFHTVSHDAVGSDHSLKIIGLEHLSNRNIMWSTCRVLNFLVATFLAVIKVLCVFFKDP